MSFVRPPLRVMALENAGDVPGIISARLMLDALRVDDAAALFAYRGDPDIARFQSWQPTSIAHAREFIEALAPVRINTPDTWFQYAIRLRDGGPLIGDLGLHFPQDPDSAVELGISIAPAYQGQRFAKEALRAALDYVFRTLGKHRACASVDPRNHASMALLRGVGMRQEAHFMESLRLGNEWVDDVVFGVLSKEWPSKSV
jgi:RimJ/RimL family protein N-acetyltransferase